MTNQELFDRVATHLLTQGKRSVVREGCEEECRYRDLDGLKCAIGCLIPDDMYSENLEGKNPGNIEVIKATGISYDQVSLAKRLQAIHDSYQPKYWRTELREIAAAWGISAAVCQ